MNAFHRLQSLRMENDEKGYVMEDMRPRFQTMASRHENGTAPRAMSAYQLFQTPEPLAQRMVDRAEILPCHSVLEPSAGLGRLLNPILTKNPREVLAVEENQALAGEVFRQFASVRIAQGDFLARHFGKFDRVVMNPPFHLQSDIKHVQHAMTHLSPGGVLVGLCLSTHHRETALRHLCNHWEIIPAGAFSKEGTSVETVLFRIQF